MRTRNVKPASTRAAPSPSRSRARGRFGDRTSDLGQAALVLVVALTVAMTTVGGVLVSNISNNDPILKQASIQRYAYRALASGLNAYQSIINADPYLAACNANTNVGGSNAQAQCAGISYQTWSQVPGTDTGNGVIPEYYKFDNPEEIIDPTTQALIYLEVQVVGAAGLGGGKDVYYSTVAKFTPANGFLDNVWWSNYESSPSNGQPLSATNACSYYWATGYNNSGDCTPVYFANNNKITGPVFSNDSIFVDSGPNFGTGYGVTTADPKCQFVDPLDGTHGQAPTGSGNNNCTLAATQDVGTYSAALSSFGADNLEPIPHDNQSLENYAEQGGCFYTGPTTITLSAAGMVVSSPGTTSNASGDSNGSSHLNDFSTDTSVCPVNNTTPVALPNNGVIYVGQDPTPVAGANPFDGVTTHTGCPYGYSQCTIDNQTSVSVGSSVADPSCGGCYYGQTGTPDSEGDAFVSGTLSGHLTIGSANDVIIDGPITYNDCTWTGTASQSNCNYNNASTGINDTLGLIAYNYVEIDRPISSPNGSILPNCGTSGAQAAPLCDPAGKNNGGLTIDASLLALQQSFFVNNYSQGGTEGNLTIYGSVQQDARGAVGTFNGSQSVSGYDKVYLWDPRLQLYSPPFYLTPGTASWALTSSAESYNGTEPVCPPVQATPTKANGTTQYPYPTYPPTVANGSTTAGTGTCSAAS